MPRRSPGFARSARFFAHGNLAATERSRAVRRSLGRCLAQAAKSGSRSLFWCGTCGSGRGSCQFLPSAYGAHLAAAAALRGCRHFPPRLWHLGLGPGTRTVTPNRARTVNTRSNQDLARSQRPLQPAAVTFFQSPDSCEKLKLVKSLAEWRCLHPPEAFARTNSGPEPCSVIDREPERRYSTHLSGRSTPDGGATPILVPVNPCEAPQRHGRVRVRPALAAAGTEPGRPATRGAPADELPLLPRSHVREHPANFR